MLRLYFFTAIQIARVAHRCYSKRLGNLGNNYEMQPDYNVTDDLTKYSLQNPWLKKALKLYILWQKGNLLLPSLNLSKCPSHIQSVHPSLVFIYLTRVLKCYTRLLGRLWPFNFWILQLTSLLMWLVVNNTNTLPCSSHYFQPQASLHKQLEYWSVPNVSLRWFLANNKLIITFRTSKFGDVP